jgi:hypothetical protein
MPPAVGLGTVQLVIADDAAVIPDVAPMAGRDEILGRVVESIAIKVRCHEFPATGAGPAADRPCNRRLAPVTGMRTWSDLVEERSPMGCHKA